MNKVENVKVRFIERLKSLMIDNNLSISSLSKQVNIPRTTINNWLLNKRTIQLDNLCVLADFFCVSIDYLVGREN